MENRVLRIGAGTGITNFFLFGRRTQFYTHSGAKPTGTEFTGLTGRHTATLKGPDGSSEWIEASSVDQIKIVAR